MKVGRESILTLKATKEGPRQVLIVGSRNKPIAVRDAATGKKDRSHHFWNWILSIKSVAEDLAFIGDTDYYLSDKQFILLTVINVLFCSFKAW